MEQAAVVRRRNPALPWFAAAVCSAVIAFPALVWGELGTTPVWLDVGTAAALGVGLVCFVVATILRAREQRVSTLRLIGRVLWAPIRFIFEFLP